MTDRRASGIFWRGARGMVGVGDESGEERAVASVVEVPAGHGQALIER
ncbi:hypothetical protein AB0M94_36255 [Streptomyces xanthochromogenes]